MILAEAKGIIDSRIELIESDYMDQIPEYYEALKIASRCIEKQFNLVEILDDLLLGDKNDSYSRDLVIELLHEAYAGEEGV